MARANAFEMQSFAACGLDEALHPELVEQCPHATRGVLQRCPRQLRVRIEIERDAVGPVEPRKARAPRVELEAAVLHGANDVGDIGEPHERRRVTLVGAS